MRYRNRTIKSVAAALNVLKAQNQAQQVIWFRGQAKENWNLIPSLARKPKHLPAEHALIKRFMQNATPHLDSTPQEEWEWLFLMQHHRAYTRLLDWTESPLVALYFTVCETRYLKQNGAVWCLDPVALNGEAKIKFDFESEIPAFGTDPVMDNYLPSRVQDNPSKLNPVAIVGPRNTPRMAAQLGTFTINHILHTPIEEIGAKVHIWKWTIPSDVKTKLRDELSYLGISPLTVFPDLDRVADLSRELLP